MSCYQTFDGLCHKIIKPSRHPRDYHSLILQRFRHHKPRYELFTILNNRHESLSTILFLYDLTFQLPSILFLHGNGGDKMYCLQLVTYGLNIFAFDFAACGSSDGEYLTYGEREVDDIEVVMNYLKRRYGVDKVVVWGRSMGASLAMMFASRKGEGIRVQGMILDSPFKYLRKVVTNIARQSKTTFLPYFLITMVVTAIYQKVSYLCNTNIFQHNFLMHLNLLDIPILFAYSRKDIVVTAEEVLELYGAYRGEKWVFAMEALHHYSRSKEFVERGMEFVRSVGGREGREIGGGGGRKGISLSSRCIG